MVKSTLGCVHFALFPDEQGDGDLSSRCGMIDTDEMMAASFAPLESSSFVDYDTGSRHTTETLPQKA